MNDLAQYRARIGEFAAIASKLRFSNSEKLRSNTRKKGIPFDIHSRQTRIQCLMLVTVLCFYLLQLNHYHSLNTTTKCHHSLKIWNSCQCNTKAIHLNNMFGNVNSYGNLDDHKQGTVGIQSESSSCIDVIVSYLSSVNFWIKNIRNHDNTSVYIVCNRLEFGLPCSGDCCFRLSNIIHRSIYHAMLKITFLGIYCIPGTSCFLLGNKGMHSYNGNNQTERLIPIHEIINKHRLCILLVDGGAKALRNIIYRIVLEIKLKHINHRSARLLCENDRKKLFPGGCGLPSLDGLTQAGLNMVWTTALQQCPVASGYRVNHEMIYDYLTEVLDIQLKNNKERLQELFRVEQLLSKEQWEVLYPRLNRIVDLESFDVTLSCFVILRVFQFKPSSGIWGQYPPTSDVGIGDDILRLRKQRNILAQNSSRMDNSTFKNVWTAITNVLARLMPEREFADEIKLIRDNEVNLESIAKYEQLICDWENHDRRLEKIERENDESMNQENLEMSRKILHYMVTEFKKANVKSQEDMEQDVKMSQGNLVKDVTMSLENLSHESLGTQATSTEERMEQECSTSENNCELDSELQENEENYSNDSTDSDDLNLNQKIMESTMKTWREEKIYMTKSVAAIKEKISLQNCVCVVGVPGAGKSTAIHHAALSLENEGFVLYLIKGPEEISKHFVKDKRQLFILDDVLGIYSVKQSKLNSWESENDAVVKVLGKNTKLLVAIRTQIYKEAVEDNNFVFLDKSTCIDLCDKTYRLEKSDMIDMLTHCLTVEAVDNIDELIRKVFYMGATEEELQIMSEETRQSLLSSATIGQKLSDCFPLLCKVFCSSDSVRRNPQEFFRNPFQALSHIFNAIKSGNRLQFCGLVLCTLFDGKLTEDMFSINFEYDDLLDETVVELHKAILKSCGLGRQFLPKIESALNSLNGVYITKIEDTYQMSHTVFHDAVTFVFNNTQPFIILNFGTSQFVRDRIRILETQPEDDPYMIIMNDDKNIERLANRLFKDIESDLETGAVFIAENPNIDNDKLVSCLDYKLPDRKMSEETDMTDVLFKKCMEIVYVNRTKYRHGNVPQYKLIELCVKKGVDCNMYIDHYGQSPIHISVQSSSVQLTQLFVAHGADIRRLTWFDYSVLLCVCRYAKYNKFELLELLTKQKVDPSLDFYYDIIKGFVKNSLGKLVRVPRVRGNILTYVNGEGRNILHYLVDDVKSTRYILRLPEIKQAINKRDYEGRTPCWYVVNKQYPCKGAIELDEKDREDMLQLYENNGAILMGFSDVSSDETSDESSDENSDQSSENVEVIYNQNVQEL